MPRFGVLFLHHAVSAFLLSPILVLWHASSDADAGCGGVFATAFGPTRQEHRHARHIPTHSRLGASPNPDPPASGSAATTKPEAAIKGLGRLYFCYDRLNIERPSDQYLKDTPPLVIAADLEQILNQQAEASAANGKLLPEQPYIAVLDAYMVAYRKARKNKAQKEDGHQEEMDAVVDGMQSAMLILNKCDHQAATIETNNETTDDDDNDDNELRTVDPYATVVHMLLELTLDDEGRSSRWNEKSLRVLSALESNRILATPRQANRRLVQYNKILQGLASHPNTIGVAVGLLDRMLGRTVDSVSFPSGGDDDGDDDDDDDLMAVQTALQNLEPGPGIVPKAKTFKLILQSPFLKDDNDARRLINDSISLGVFEGYLEKSLKQSLGEEKLSNWMGE